MEAQMERGFDRSRYLIPSIVVVALIVAISAGIYWSGKKKSGGSGNAAATADSKDKKKNGEEKKKDPVPVSVLPVAVGTISSYVSSTANLVAENEVKIVAESEGRIGRLLVEEGAFVTQGQTLASLARDDAGMAYSKAQARANNAQATYARAKDLVEKDLLSRGDYDKAAMERNVARQELEEARFRLGKNTIRAPFSGRVTQRGVKLGQHVRPGDILFTITDYDPLIALIFLPEKEVFALQPGREVRIKLKAAENVSFGGRIRQISPVVDVATGTVKITIEAVNPPPSVRPGAFVSIDIIRDTHPGAMLLPRVAVIRELQKAHVFIANGASAQKRAVSLGLEEGDHIEVLSGVKPGENIIVAGQGGLKDGSPIKVLANSKA